MAKDADVGQAYLRHHMTEGQRMAGDVLPIRPILSPSTTAARAGQAANKGAQTPNTGSKDNNIYGLYGHITTKD